VRTTIDTNRMAKLGLPLFLLLLHVRNKKVGYGAASIRTLFILRFVKICHVVEKCKCGKHTQTQTARRSNNTHFISRKGKTGQTIMLHCVSLYNSMACAIHIATALSYTM
jgi:hypothetical protein